MNPVAALWLGGGMYVLALIGAHYEFPWMLDYLMRDPLLWIVGFTAFAFIVAMGESDSDSEEEKVTTLLVVNEE